MLLQQKVMLISREVIERAGQRDEQTEVLTEVWTRFQGPQYVLPLTMALLTSYTVNARYAESAFGRLTTRANNDNNNVIKPRSRCHINHPEMHRRSGHSEVLFNTFG